MKIGELSAQSATHVETIRYYERVGLLPAPARTEGNFRAYEPAHLDRLQFIRNCRGLDMSLDEVRALLQVRDAPDGSCEKANALVDAHIGHVAERLRELRQLERELLSLRERCREPHEASDCGILAGLTSVAVPEAVSGSRARTHLR